MFLVISTSLNPGSRSRVLAGEVYLKLRERSEAVELVDLQQWNLPFCDGGPCYENEEVQRLGKMVEAARGIVLATPVYNYDVSATTKNLVELTGKAWSEKVVGFVCAAGGKVSYMALMALANSLMLDFRALIVPRFVFATGKSFDEQNRLTDPEVRERLAQLVETLARLTRALHS